MKYETAGTTQSSSLLKESPRDKVMEPHSELSLKQRISRNCFPLSESHAKYLQKQHSLNRHPVIKITIIPASKSLKKQRKQWNKTQNLQTTALDNKNCLSSQNVYTVFKGQARKRVSEIKATGSEDFNSQGPCKNEKNLQSLPEKTDEKNKEMSADAIKHYQGDKCRVSNPLQRDKEIRELLGVHRLVPSRSTQIPRTLMESSKFHDSSYISHQNDGCNDFNNIQKLPEVTTGTLQATEETPEPHNKDLDMYHESSNSCKIRNLNKRIVTKKSSQDFKYYTGWQKSVFTITNHVSENNRKSTCTQTVLSWQEPVTTPELNKRSRQNMIELKVCDSQLSSHNQKSITQKETTKESRYDLQPPSDTSYRVRPEIGDNSSNIKDVSDDILCVCHHSHVYKPSQESYRKTEPELVNKPSENKISSIDLVCESQKSRPIQTTVKLHHKNPKKEFQAKAMTELYFTQEISQKNRYSRKNNIGSQISESFQGAVLARRDFAQQTSAFNNSFYQNSSLSLNLTQQTHCKIHTQNDERKIIRTSQGFENHSGDRLFNKVSDCNGYHNLRVPKNRSHKNYKIPLNLDQFLRNKPILLSKKQFTRMRRVILQASPKKISAITKRSSVTIGKIKIKRIAKKCPVASKGTQTEKKNMSRPQQQQQPRLYERGTDFNWVRVPAEIFENQCIGSDKSELSNGAGDTLISQTVKEKNNIINNDEKSCYVYYMNTGKFYSHSLTSRFMSSCTEICCTSVSENKRDNLTNPGQWKNANAEKAMHRALKKKSSLLCVKKSSSKNLRTSASCPSTEYFAANTQSNVEISQKNQRTRKPFFRRLISCLVMRFKISGVKIGKPPAKPPSPSIHNSTDWYHISTSLQTLELSSSIYETTASFYTNHSVLPINNNKARGGILDSFRALIRTNRRY